MDGNASEHGPKRTKIILINHTPETWSEYILRNVMDFKQQQRQRRKSGGTFLEFYGIVPSKTRAFCSWKNWDRSWGPPSFGPGAHPESCRIDTAWFFIGLKWPDHEVDKSPRAKSRISGPVPRFSHTPVQHAQGHSFSCIVKYIYTPSVPSWKPYVSKKCWHTCTKQLTMISQSTRE